MSQHRARPPTRRTLIATTVLAAILAAGAGGVYLYTSASEPSGPAGAESLLARAMPPTAPQAATVAPPAPAVTAPSPAGSPEQAAVATGSLADPPASPPLLTTGTSEPGRPAPVPAPAASGQSAAQTASAAVSAPAPVATAPPPAAPSTGPHPRPPALPSAEAEHLLERGRELIRLGDLAGARLVLQRIASDDNGAALFALAETYDPNVLRQLGVRGGVAGDRDKARDLYARAGRAGLRESEARLAGLQ